MTRRHLPGEHANKALKPPKGATARDMRELAKLQGTVTKSNAKLTKASDKDNEKT